MKKTGGKSGDNKAGKSTGERSAQEPREQPISIMLRLADECLSLTGILQTIGENFADDTEQLKASIYSSYKEDEEEKDRLWATINAALPTEELRTAFRELDMVWCSEVAAGERAFLVLGIVFGMKLNGAPEKAIRRVCQMMLAIE